MKRFNLLALVVFLSVNVFTPIGYAGEIFGGKQEILENVIENAVDGNNDIVGGNEVPEDEDFKFSNLGHLDSPVESPEKHEVTDEDGLEGFSDDVNSGGFGDDVNSGGFNDDVSSEEFNDDVNSEGLDIIEENLSKEWELVMQDDNIGNNASGSYDLTTFQKAFQEVAYAYYMRGSYLHYNVAKGIGNILSPEQSTSQDYHHMACALYVMNVYKELLGIDLTPADGDYSRYADKYKGQRKEVIGYGKLQTGGVNSGDLYWYDGSKNEQGELNVIVNPTQSYVISQLKIGDILDYAGHVMLVYDYVFDESGNVVDVYLINSTTSYNYTSRMKAGHGTTSHYYNKNNEDTTLILGYAPWSNLYFNYRDRRGIYEESRIEGTVFLETFTERANRDGILLFDKMNSKNKYKEYYSILRLVDTDEGGNSVLNFDGSYVHFKTATQNEVINNQIIDYSDSVKSRLKYDKLYIEKTVDKRDNNIVEPGDELIYKIVIKNESKKAYNEDLIVKENIDTNLVENLSIYNYIKNGTQTNEIQLSNNGNQLQWNIGELDSGDEITIEYTAKVKEGNVGKTIESTGMVDNIPSGTVRNKIGKNLKDQDSISIGNKYEELKTQYTGKMLINEIYKRVYNVDLELDNFNIKAINAEDGNGLIVYNEKWGAWRYSETRHADMYINKNNKYSKMVLNSYFNVLYKDTTERISLNGVNIILYVIPGLWTEEKNPDNRANTVYPTDFKTGDILIYTNTNDKKYYVQSNTHNTKEDIITNEDGEYAYIYIDGKFVGVNLGNDGQSGTLDDRNDFDIQYYTNNNLSLYTKSNTTLQESNELKEFLLYQTLFGKDVYVILRPSLMIRSINYELKGGINNVDNPTSGFILGSDNVLKEPTKSGYTFNGWFTDSGYTNQVSSTSELTDDTVLYAKWGKNTEYVINYNLNEGIVSGENATRYTIESESITLTNPIKTGYTFVGWSGTDIDGVSLTVTIPKGSIGDRTYEANRNVNQYTIIFNADGGSEVTSITADYNSVITAPINPTKNGYRFVKWEPELPTTMPLDGLTLKAIWEKNGSSGGGGGGSSGGGSHEGSNNSSTGSNINTNQHGSADENQNKTRENIETGKIVENMEKIYNEKNGIIVRQTVISNNPNYSKEFNGAYSFAKSNGITTVYSIEKAKLNTTITRIQMAKMLSNYALNVLGMKPDLSKGTITFSDVTEKMDKQYDNGVTLSYVLGIMGQNMKNNQFRPNDEVTRAEFVTALSRLLYHTEDGKGKIKYYEPHMAKLYDKRIINKKDPKMKELCGYVMLMLMRSAK